MTIHGPDATRGADAVRRVVKDALFDSDSFIEVPVMDGQATDRLRIALAGSIEYLASDSVGQKLFEGMTLGKSVDLQVEGTVVKKSGAWKMNADDEETVTGGVGIKIHSIYVLTPEEL